VPPIRSIAILFHERALHAAECHYRIWAIAETWKARGIRVEPIWGIARETDADLLIPHLDLSYIPDDYWAFIQRHPNVVNRKLRDIRKTRYTTVRVGPNDIVDGPVIVKTICNCGGFGDDTLSARGLTSLIRRVRRRITSIPLLQPRCLRFARTLAPYPVFDSIRDVPRAVFKNPHLFVERFIPEPRGNEFILRLHTVFGSSAIGRIVVSSDPYVKAWNGKLAEGTDAPPEILAWREQLGLDYGKLDYTIRDGKPVLIDVNTTPTMSDPPLIPAAVERSVVLADGLGYFEQLDR
jgi:hypothetical protein